MEVTQKNTQAVGLAGELRVRSELILRGFHPATFDYDDGTDIILSNGKRIGVKTASRPLYRPKSYSYVYMFSLKWQKIREGDGVANYKKVYDKRDWSNHVDYWILWCIRHDLFYIIPNSEVRAKFAFVVPTPDEKRKYKKQTWKETYSKYDKYKNNWEQLR